jgi:hypothetical protein
MKLVGERCGRDGAFSVLVVAEEKRILLDTLTYYHGTYPVPYWQWSSYIPFCRDKGGDARPVMEALKYLGFNPEVVPRILAAENLRVDETSRLTMGLLANQNGSAEIAFFTSAPKHKVNVITSICVERGTTPFGPYPEGNLLRWRTNMIHRGWPNKLFQRTTMTPADAQGMQLVTGQISEIGFNPKIAQLAFDALLLRE